MRFKSSFPSIAKALDDIQLTIARTATGSMQDAVDGLKAELRGQVMEAGMGQRLANTWRGDVYPKVYGRVCAARTATSSQTLLIWSDIAKRSSRAIPI